MTSSLNPIFADILKAHTGVSQNRKTISVRQPWAWLIVNGFKDVENRSRRFNHRGELWIHASAYKSPRLYAHLEAFIASDSRLSGVLLPPFDQLVFGAVIGKTFVRDCVSSSPSPWFTGPYGLVLEDSEPFPAIPAKGRLGIFEWVDERRAA